MTWPVPQKQESPPRLKPGGRQNRCFWLSTLKGIAAFSVISLSGVDRQPRLLPNGSGQETPFGVRLPTGGFHDFLKGVFDLALDFATRGFCGAAVAFVAAFGCSAAA